MTMQVNHSPKPKIFGKGYGTHVAANFKLMKRFFWLGWKLLANTFIPSVFYENAHWEVIDLYHRMRGYRHGTNCDHRCESCGADTPSDEMYSIRDARKTIKRLQLQIADLEQNKQTAPVKELQKGIDSE